MSQRGTLAWDRVISTMGVRRIPAVILVPQHKLSILDWQKEQGLTYTFWLFGIAMINLNLSFAYSFFSFECQNSLVSGPFLSFTNFKIKPNVNKWEHMKKRKDGMKRDSVALLGRGWACTSFSHFLSEGTGSEASQWPISKRRNTYWNVFS